MHILKPAYMRIILVLGAPYLHAVDCRLLAGHPVGHWRDYLPWEDVTAQNSMSLCLPIYCCKGIIEQPLFVIHVELVTSPCMTDYPCMHVVYM